MTCQSFSLCNFVLLEDQGLPEEVLSNKKTTKKNNVLVMTSEVSTHKKGFNLFSCCSEMFYCYRYL